MLEHWKHPMSARRWVGISSTRRSREWERRRWPGRRLTWKGWPRRRRREAILNITSFGGLILHTAHISWLWQIWRKVIFRNIYNQYWCVQSILERCSVSPSFSCFLVRSSGLFCTSFFFCAFALTNVSDHSQRMMIDKVNFWGSLIWPDERKQLGVAKKDRY